MLNLSEEGGDLSGVKEVIGDEGLSMNFRARQPIIRHALWKCICLFD